MTANKIVIERNRRQQTTRSVQCNKEDDLLKYGPFISYLQKNISTKGDFSSKYITFEINIDVNVRL